MRSLRHHILMRVGPHPHALTRLSARAPFGRPPDLYSASRSTRSTRPLGSLQQVLLHESHPREEVEVVVGGIGERDVSFVFIDGEPHRYTVRADGARHLL